MIESTSFASELEDGVATLTLDRPQRLNALTFEVYAELAAAFEDLDHHDDVRAIVITGRGRGFCSGGDQDDIIKHLLGRDTPALLTFTRMTGRLIAAIRRCRRPVIAAINGVAVGAGAVIACAADLRIAAADAKLGFIFPPVGLSGADMGIAYLLPRIVGLGHASELLFFGDKIDASEKAKIEDHVARVKKAMEGDDAAAIRSAQDELARASHKLAEAMYAKTAGPQPGQWGVGASTSDAGRSKTTSMPSGAGVRAIDPPRRRRASGFSPPVPGGRRQRRPTHRHGH